jgi:hypothetical protein
MRRRCVILRVRFCRCSGGGQSAAGCGNKNLLTAVDAMLTRRRVEISTITTKSPSRRLGTKLEISSALEPTFVLVCDRERCREKFGDCKDEQRGY